MQVSKEILDDIAGSMEAGFKCFIHKDTLEIVTYLDPDHHPDMELKDWREEINKIKKGRGKFIEIENMNSTESFRIMEAFVNSRENNSTKIRLLTVLEGRKPFANFKFQIDNSGDYRDQWFVFRKEKITEWIKDSTQF